MSTCILENLMHRENMCSKFIKRKSRYTSNGLNITDQHHCLKLGKWNSDAERERERESIMQPLEDSNLAKNP